MLNDTKAAKQTTQDTRGTHPITGSARGPYQGAGNSGKLLGKFGSTSISKKRSSAQKHCSYY